MHAGKVAGAAVVLALILGATGLSAHRLDECLQAARIAIEPDHVALELSITPGVEVVDRILTDVDRSGDGQITTDEQQAFANAVLDSIELSGEGRALDLTRSAITFPDIDALRRGEGTILLQLTASLPTPAKGDHQVSFRNGYRPEVSVYLANALVPESNRIVVAAQHRTVDQRELTIDYAVRDAGSPAAWVLSGVAAALAVLVVAPSRRRPALKGCLDPTGSLDRVVSVDQRHA